MNLENWDWIWGPIEYFSRANKRIFFPFLISVFIMLVVRKLCYSQHSLKKDLATAFDRKIWFHRSSRVDVLCLFLNNWLAVLLLTPLLWNVKEIVIWVSYQLNVLFQAKGLLAHWPQFWVTLLYTVVLFTCSDLSRFLLHYALHRFPILWRFHKVHHSAEVLTPISVYRAHPIEMILYKLRGLFVIGLVSGVFYFLFLGKMRIWDILGVNIFGFVFNLLGANLRHSQIWMGWGIFEWVFISPAQHQMHHNRDSKLGRTNIGSCFAIWDWLFGTLKFSKSVPEGDRYNYGIEDSKLNHNPKSWLSSVLGPLKA